MRIAYVHDTLCPETKGGVERRVWEVARRSVKRSQLVRFVGFLEEWHQVVDRTERLCEASPA